MRPKALTQAARSAASHRRAAQPSRRDAAQPRAKSYRQSAEPRTKQRSAGAPRSDQVARPGRPPRRISGPLRGGGGSSRVSGAGQASGTSRASGAARSSGASRASGAARSSGASRVSGAVRSSGASRVSGAARSSGVPRFRATAAAAVAAAAGPRVAAATAVAAAPRAGAIAWPLRPLAGGRTRVKPAGGPAQRVGAFVASLPDHALLDRLVRGRAWIPVLGVLLAGIVAMQVEILKLGASMGRAIEQTTTLTSQNEQLRESVAMLGDDRRIERLASGMGMVLPPPGAVGYLSSGPSGNVSGALANIHSPNPSAFVALTPQDGDGALVTGPGTSTLPSLPGAPVPPATTGVTTSSGAAAALSTGTASSAATGSTTGSTAASGGSQSSSGTVQPGTTTTSEAPTTSSQAPATTSQAPAATSQAQTTISQAAAGTGQTGSGVSTDPGSQSPATGAAAIQPADSNQQPGGG